MEQGETGISNFCPLFSWQKNVDLLITIKTGKKSLSLPSSISDISNTTGTLADNTKAVYNISRFLINCYVLGL